MNQHPAGKDGCIINKEQTLLMGGFGIMKKTIVALVSVLFLALSDGFCELPIKFNGIGAGAELGLVVPEDEELALGVGLKGMAEFSLGRFGTLQYVPSLIFWIKYDDWKENGIEHEQRLSQIFLNFLDFKYLFPLPEKYFVKPYVGVTPIIPFIAISRESMDLDPGKDYNTSDAHACLNIFAGVDFPVTKIFRPYAEWRFSLTNDWAMKLSGGVTIHF